MTAKKVAKKKAAGSGGFAMPATVSRRQLLDDGGRTDRRFRQMLYDFSALGANLEVARAHLAARLGLSSPQYNLVMIVAQYQGADGVSVSEVAQHMHVTTAFVTGEVRRLEQQGWVEKRPNPRDGRGVLLRLGAKGEAGVREIGEERRRVNDALFQRLGEREFRQLAGTLSGLLDDFAAVVAAMGGKRRRARRGGSEA